MNPGHTGLHTFAIFAILFLLGFGFVAYAAPEKAASASTASTGEQGSTAMGDSLSYALIPLPVYLHQATPPNYSFVEGGALVVLSGDQLQLKISFLGSAKTSFTTVVQTAGQNITAGKVTTGQGGGGVFRETSISSPAPMKWGC